MATCKALRVCAMCARHMADGAQGAGYPPYPHVRMTSACVWGSPLQVQALEAGEAHERARAGGLEADLRDHKQAVAVLERERGVCIRVHTGALLHVHAHHWLCARVWVVCVCAVRARARVPVLALLPVHAWT